MGGLLNLLARGAGLALGAGAARQAASRWGVEARPAIKEAVRAGLTAADRLERMAAEAREQFEDIVAEVRAEQREGTGERRP